MRRKTKTVMVFGAFDGLHPGHEAFLRQARKYGHLIAVVARDASIRRLKNHPPQSKEQTRIARLRRTRLPHRVVIGDKREGEYNIIRRYRPDIIVLGYDQRALFKDISERMRRGELTKLKLTFAKAFHSRRLHSSLLSG